MKNCLLKEKYNKKLKIFSDFNEIINNENNFNTFETEKKNFNKNIEKIIDIDEFNN